MPHGGSRVSPPVHYVMNAGWITQTSWLCHKKTFLWTVGTLTETSLRCFMCPARLERLIRVYRDDDALLTGFL